MAYIIPMSNSVAPSPTDPVPDASNAKLRLVEAATSLFGEHGIEGVALKDILERAGQKNQSAVQYHFGSKDGLVAAALKARFLAIDARRAAMLAGLETLDRESQRALVLRATVEPIVVEAESHSQGPLYVRFVAQALQRSDQLIQTHILSDAHAGFKAVMAALARERKGPVSREELAQRIRMTMHLTMTAIADWVAHDFGPHSREDLISRLAAANAALLL
ncbi:MAG TPA: hypothetical protein DCL48_15810 [Alphaproteobacteria bacterium]|nr:hypothetical protein [Alphaproteobacteria bacterium]